MYLNLISDNLYETTLTKIFYTEFRVPKNLPNANPKGPLVICAHSTENIGVAAVVGEEALPEIVRYNHQCCTMHSLPSLHTVKRSHRCSVLCFASSCGTVVRPRLICERKPCASSLYSQRRKCQCCWGARCSKSTNRSCSQSAASAS